MSIYPSNILIVVLSHMLSWFDWNTMRFITYSSTDPATHDAWSERKDVSGQRKQKRPASPWQTWRDQCQKAINCRNARTFFFMLRPKSTRGMLVLPLQKKNDEQRGAVSLAKMKKKEMDIKLLKERSAFGLSKRCMAWSFTICVRLTRYLLCIYPLAGAHDPIIVHKCEQSTILPYMLLVNQLVSVHYY